MARSLAELCTPRPSVFDPSVRDTVWDIGRLDQIDADDFFEETYVTQGMRQLLGEAFARLEGSSDSAPGVFLLSQSMGGGKTHNLIALALLAKHQRLRKAVMEPFHQPAPLGTVRVVTVNGRDPDVKFGLWGSVAGQLNRREQFADLYSPLQPPGVSRWVELLRGEPTLILLDELPPYFSHLQSVPVGSTTLDAITTTALANLMVAVNSGQLPNVCVVLTDLGATAYEEGSAAVSRALTDLEQETNRTAQRIDPVRLNTDELYHVLRTRLFSRLPDADAVGEVADAYGRAVDAARRTDQTTIEPQAVRVGIETSYPFHPAIRDLYARFRENSGFQQTRALLRIMRAVVADLWQSGRAGQRYLVAAHDLDLHDESLLRELKQVNRSLENAIAHDIANDSRTSAAELIDGPAGRDAQDAATLIFLSSLATVPNAVKGLDRSTVTGWLATPGRDLGGLRGAIDRLQAEAWYLHTTGTSLLEFRDVRNINAMVDDYSRGMSVADREIEIRERLRPIFEPRLKTCYGAISVLEPLNPAAIAPDAVTLIAFRPEPDAKSEIDRFYEQLANKNRVLFLTGSPNAYERVNAIAATLRAIKAVIAELRQQYRDGDPQLEDAKVLQSQQEASFYLALRETFQTLLFPSGQGLVEVQLSPQYAANNYVGEDLVSRKLEEVYKFKSDAAADPEATRKTIENKLWPAAAKEANWDDVKRRAATDPSWPFTHPRALDEVRDALVREDKWRAVGNGFVEKGPFPPPPASVTFQVLSRDPDTGETTIKVTPRHAERVLREEAGGYAPVADYTIRTKDVVLTFVPADAQGHATGDPVTYTAPITVKHRFFQDGDGQRCELQAIPAGTIRYTVDGSSPSTSGQPYDAPFPVPAGSKFVLAVASVGKVSSETVRFPVQDRAGRTEVDREAPAVWRRELKADATGDVFHLLDQMKARDASAVGSALLVQSDRQYAEFRTSEGVPLGADQLREHAEALQKVLPGANLALDLNGLSFRTGQDLLDFVADRKTALQPGEVVQS